MNSTMKKVMLLGLMGGEYIELVSFAALTPVVGQLFFSHSEPWLQQLSAVIVFILAYIVRPLSGYLVGRYGDIFGRRHALMKISAWGAFFSLAIGLLPTGTVVGTCLLFILRLGQGFALSDDSVLTAVWLNENSDRPKFWTSVVVGALAMSTMLAHLLVTSLKSSLSPELFMAYGWRVPFILSAVLIVLSRLLRRSLPDSVPEPSTAHCRSVDMVRAFMMTFAYGFLVINYMYLPMWLPIIAAHLHVGWVAAFIASIFLGLYPHRLSIALSGTLLVSGLLVSWLCRESHPYVFTMVYQCVLLQFITTCYSWFIEVSPADKRGRIFGLFSNLGMSCAAAIFPYLIVMPKAQAFEMSLLAPMCVLALLIIISVITKRSPSAHNAYSSA